MEKAGRGRVRLVMEVSSGAVALCDALTRQGLQFCFSPLELIGEALRFGRGIFHRLAQRTGAAAGRILA